MTDRRTQILDAAEDLFRRHGLEKTGVVDIARALGVSHAAVYRYFADKDALREAVAERWLVGVSAPLATLAASEAGEASAQLEAWVKKLASIKAGRLRDDPELFRTYHAMVEQSRHVVERHVAELERQLAVIIDRGRSTGEFKTRNTKRAARAILNATLRFHHPYFLLHSGEPVARKKDLDDMLRLIIDGVARGSL